MRKIIYSVVLVFIVSLICATPANAGAGYPVITNSGARSFATYSSKNCSGYAYRLYPGNSIWGYTSFKASADGVVKWSTGTTTHFSYGQCLNVWVNGAKVYIY